MSEPNPFYQPPRMLDSNSLAEFDPLSQNQGSSQGTGNSNPFLNWSNTPNTSSNSNTDFDSSFNPFQSNLNSNTNPFYNFNPTSSQSTTSTNVKQNPSIQSHLSNSNSNSNSNVNSPKFNSNQNTTRNSSSLSSTSSSDLFFNESSSRNTTTTSSSNPDVDFILAMFPDYPRSVIEKELIATKSKEATINNILDGNVQIPPQERPNSSQSQSQSNTPPSNNNSNNIQSLRIDTQQYSEELPPEYEEIDSSLFPPDELNQINQPNQSSPANQQRNSFQYSPNENQFQNFPVDDIIVDKNLIKEYDRIENLITELTAASVEENYQLCVKNLQYISEQRRLAENNYFALQKLTKKEYKDTLKYKKLTGKSIHARLKGNLEEKIAREEQIYIQARSREEAAKKEVEELFRQQNELDKQAKSLQSQVRNLQQSKKRLQDILDKIFSGPVGSPEENRLTKELKDIEADRRRAAADKTQFETGSQYINIAQQSLSMAVMELENTNMAATYDMFASYHLSDIAENSSIATVRNLVQNGRINLEHALRHIPNIPYVKPGDVTFLNTFVNLIFDNFITDYLAKQKIMQSVQELKDIAVRVGYARAWADETFASSIIPIFQNLDTIYHQAQNELSQERQKLVHAILRNQN